MSAARASLPAALLLPWLVLFAMLGTTWFVWDHERENARKEMHTQFDFALRDTVSRVEQRVAAYEQMLRGVQGLFATTGIHNRGALRDYVATLQLDADFSGIQVIGLIERVPQSAKAAHITAMRRLGYADYDIHPDQVREIYAPVIHGESYTGDKNTFLGLDIWADPLRRQEMEKARDSGMAAISGKVQLAIDKGSAGNPGFVMYLPVFAPGQPRDSVAQRRAHLIGWVYAACHMSDFMASLYGKQAEGLAFAIYDGATPNDRALMYRIGNSRDSADGAMRADEYMVVAGHTWTLTLVTQDEFETRFGRDISMFIAVAGIGLSVAMALLAWFMINGRARALQLAAKMTEELRHAAQHDSLTGLPNRALFSDRVQSKLAHARRHEERFAMIFIDVDKFKEVNDNYGHAVGDLLLQQVARRLQDSIRASDTAGRIGGDEFVLLIGELAGPDAATTLAAKIRAELRRPYRIDGDELSISCSLGVAIHPDDGEDEVALTRRADEAMYRDKDTGGAGVAPAP